MEAREEFTLKERQAAIVPDAFVVIRDGEAEYHAMVEIDRGTMSIPRLSRKLSLYLAWVASGVWKERHPFVPALLVLTTTPRRVDQVVAKAEERCRAESRTAKTHSGAMNQFVGEDLGVRGLGRPEPSAGPDHELQRA